MLNEDINMKVTLAKDAGFCFGVKNALEKIKNMDNSPYILGKLIHNNKVINDLTQKGFRFVEDIDLIDKGSIIISAHGISDDTINKIKEKNLSIIDTTCPLVKKVHETTKDLEKQGYRIIIFGDKDHTEVKGIVGNLKCPIIINDISETEQVPKGKYALVSQTTQDVKKFKQIADKLESKFKSIIINDTICSATKSRQEKSSELAKNVDLMIVIGSHHSANTKRLAEICSNLTDTKHIETKEDLKKDWFIDKSHIGVTAGASTPEHIINEVVEDIKRY